MAKAKKSAPKKTAPKKNTAPRKKAAEEQGLTSITVSGFKSIRDPQTVNFAPLTILAGANSSGKSAMMQPLLLLKQTLEAPFNPEVFYLDGPNVKFTFADQLLSRIGKKPAAKEFTISLRNRQGPLEVTYEKHPERGFSIKQQVMRDPSESVAVTLRPKMSNDELKRILPLSYSVGTPSKLQEVGARFIDSERCFLKTVSLLKDGASFATYDPSAAFRNDISRLIHLSGLRGNPERVYPSAGAGGHFPGRFQEYAASIIADWQESKNREKLKGVAKDLQDLGLTWKVKAKRLNDAQIELLVGRLPKSARGGAHDLVNISDVGFGVSQTLPVIVALHAAKPGQLVYIEQPENDLHPKAQYAMARVLLRAAQRGARVVVETHSNMLLLGLQTLVGENEVSKELVKLHWFERDGEGVTQVTAAGLDEYGRYGDWPVDFDEVMLEVESRYLNAVEARRSANPA